MAGYNGTFIIEWKCLMPKIYHKEHGYIEYVGSSYTEVIARFKESNPDYEIINVKIKEEH